MKVLQRFRASTSSSSPHKKGGGMHKEETSRRHSIILERGSTFHSDEGTVTTCTSAMGGGADVAGKKNSSSSSSSSNDDDHDANNMPPAVGPSRRSSEPSPFRHDGHHHHHQDDECGKNNSIVDAGWEGKRKSRRRSSACGGGSVATGDGGRMRLPRSESFRCNPTRTGDAKGRTTKSTGRASAVGACASSSPVDAGRAGPRNSADEAIVRRFVERLNDRDLDGCLGLVSASCEWRFSGMEHITIKKFGDMMRSIARSFPDFAFDGDGTAAIAVQVGPGVVQMRNMIASGTHTGESFGLRNYPPLPATGGRCVNDPENVTFFLRDGRIAQVQSVASRADGRLYGPIGMYQQIKEGRVSK